MFSLEDIIGRSLSNDEIVVEYSDAMELLDIYKQSDIQVLGWEGWIKHPNGSLGHSQRHQGTMSLSAMTNSAAIALSKATIMQAYTEWGEKPEVRNAILLFCITTNLEQNDV